ncbi:uncharacterized protein LOC134212265 [Armigeres subalbatus]|uniref:uncharacterized protein LOC134212265 n=1 Tax=Armigeres subalbatus TaxID=124917 RepID=UPI002ED399EA
MLSSKVSTLCAEDIKRYKEKILVVGGEDPYNFKYSTKTLPLTVDYDGILSYLLSTLSFRTDQPVRNKKSVEAYKSFERGFVKEVKGFKRENIFAVLGTVLHSMRINEPPATCWILVQNEAGDGNEVGDILCAHCDCTAGAGETCSHVAAVLYALNFARETCLGKQISVTQLPSYWTTPSGSVHENLYASVDRITFGQTVRTNCELQDSRIQRSESELQELIRKINDSGQTVAVGGAFLS